MSGASGDPYGLNDCRFLRIGKTIASNIIFNLLELLRGFKLLDLLLILLVAFRNLGQLFHELLISKLSFFEFIGLI